jgi:DNA-binding MarR family transcriptional regulator
MDGIEALDLIFHSLMARFFAIPTRKPSTGDVTFAQIRVLWVLDISKPPLTPGDVARQLGISPSTATELVDRLERRDFLKRQASKSDRRRTVLGLRPRGRALLADFARRRRERFGRLAKAVGRGDMDRLLGAFRTAETIIGRFNGRA